jgi:membrane protein DedA with SNARE-associated domain
VDFLELFNEIRIFANIAVQRYGLAGIALVMLLESAGVPFASAVMLVTAGSMVFSGQVSIWEMVGASTVGITLGSILSYSLGYLSSKLGRVIKFTFFNGWGRKKEPQGSKSKLITLWEKYGSFSVFMGQLWGVTRTFISFPAGAMHMNFLLFALYTALGGFLFSLLAVGFSMLLTSTLSFLVKYLNFLMNLSPWYLLLVFLLLLLLGLFIMLRRRRSKAKL